MTQNSKTVYDLNFCEYLSLTLSIYISSDALDLLVSLLVHTTIARCSQYLLELEKSYLYIRVPQDGLVLGLPRRCPLKTNDNPFYTLNA